MQIADAFSRKKDGKDYAAIALSTQLIAV